MLDTFVTFLEAVGVFTLVGNIFTVLELRLPIRAFAVKREHVVDVFAVLWSQLLRFLSAAFVAVWILKLGILPGMSWMGKVRHFLATCPPVAGGILFFLIADFIAYWFHRLNHTRLLWSTHAFHHSPAHLNWASGVRESPIHHLLLTSPGVIAGLLAPLSGLFSTIAIAYGLAHNSLIHSNIRIKGRWINWLFVTGEYHFVHHSADLHYGNKNFGFLLTIWDRMFGTHVDPKTMPKDFPLGLPYEISYGRLIFGLPAPTERDPARRSSLGNRSVQRDRTELRPGV